MDALRVFRSHEAEPVGVPVDEEGLQVDVLAALLDRLPKAPEIPLHDADLPEPDGRLHVDGAAARAGRPGPGAGTRHRRGRPVRRPLVRRGSATDAEVARPRGHLPRHLLQGAGAGAARRLGSVVAAAARGVLQRQRGDGHPQRADHDAHGLSLRARISRRAHRRDAGDLSSPAGRHAGRARARDASGCALDDAARRVLPLGHLARADTRPTPCCRMRPIGGSSTCRARGSTPTAPGPGRCD